MTHQHQLLKIQVLPDRIRWQRFSCLADGARDAQLEQSNEPGLPISREDLAQAVKSIALLVDVQQLVADLRRSSQWNSQLIDGISHRVAEDLGEQLYRFLFRDSLDNLVIEVLGDTVDGLLRIELEFQGEEAERKFATWPWEYLRSPRVTGVPDSGQFLALSAQLVLNRRLTFKDALLKTSKPRVLLVVAGPPAHSMEGYGVVQADKVVATLRKLHNSGVIELSELVEKPFDLDPEWEPTASWEAFRRMVEDKRPDVIHFVGHGTRQFDVAQKTEYSQLIFVGPGAKPDPRRDVEIVNAVRNGSPHLKLVFLQACESGLPGPFSSATSVGQLLAQRGIPAVVAMQAKVENLVANDFAEAFYDALRDHKPVDFAVRAGRAAIRRASEDLQLDSLKLAFGVPVLFLQSYEALISPPELAPEMPRTGAQGNNRPRPFETCPRCGSTDIGAACPDCGLRVLCLKPECGEPLRLDPLAPPSDPFKRFCKNCGTENPQPTYLRAKDTIPPGVRVQ